MAFIVNLVYLGITLYNLEEKKGGVNMPILQIEMLEGRSIDQKRAMVKKVTEALVETINCKPEAVKIMMREIKKEHLATGGILKSDE